AAGNVADGGGLNSKAGHEEVSVPLLIVTEERKLFGVHETNAGDVPAFGPLPAAIAGPELALPFSAAGGYEEHTTRGLADEPRFFGVQETNVSHIPALGPFSAAVVLPGFALPLSAAGRAGSTSLEAPTRVALGEKTRRVVYLIEPGRGNFSLEWEELLHSELPHTKMKFLDALF